MAKVTIYKESDNIDLVMRELKTKTEKALGLIGAEARTRASRNAPKRTGTLARSYSFEVMHDEDAVLVGALSSQFPEEPYAVYVELGTSRQRAQPHLKPAIMDNIDVYKAILEKVFRS